MYLVNFASADGQAVLDHCDGVGASRRCAGFILIENDFRGGGYRDLAEGLRTVVPHEIFHLVQHAYGAEDEPWWAEGTAQWAAKQVYPELQDLERFLPAYFDNTWRPLNVPPGGVVAAFLYATAIWPVFLNERYGASTVRGVFEGLDSSARGVLETTDVLLAGQGSSLGQAFLEFASYNAATSARATSGQGYLDAPSYPSVQFEPFQAEAGATVSDVVAGLGAFYYSVRVDAPVQLELQADPGRVAALVVPIDGMSVRLEAARRLPTRVEGEAVIVVAGQSLSRTDAAFTLRAEPLEKPGSGGCSVSSRSRAGAAPVGTVLWLIGLLRSRASGRRCRVGSQSRLARSSTRAFRRALRCGS